MIIAVDASAVVAIGLNEPERHDFIGLLERAETAFIAPVNILEAGLVIVLRQQLMGLDQYAFWLARLGLVERDVPGEAALNAYLMLGKGVHRAGLNLGDCFAYALAKQLDAPLLYKGNDFSLTDIRPAFQPT